MQEKKKENVGEKAVENEQKGEEVSFKEKQEKDSLQKQTGATGIIATAGKDSIKIGYAILRQQMDELKKEIDDLRKKVDALEK